jgi:hypothetical protein
VTAPLTLGAVLFEEAWRAPYDVVCALVAAPDAPVSFRRLTPARRQPLEVELLDQVAAILARDLSDLVLAEWTDTEPVADGAERSRRQAGAPVFVPLADHRMVRSLPLPLDVRRHGAPVGFALEAHVELVLSGVILTVLDGRIAAVGAGTWSGVGSLTGHGTELARRATGAQPLPGAVVIGTGVLVGSTEPAAAPAA